MAVPLEQRQYRFECDQCSVSSIPKTRIGSTLMNGYKMFPFYSTILKIAHIKYCILGPFLGENVATCLGIFRLMRIVA
jgi:hypothetical protein